MLHVIVALIPRAKHTAQAQACHQALHGASTTASIQQVSKLPWCAAAAAAAVDCSRPDNMDMGRYTEGMGESEFLEFFK
jgi:hypothetical protein